MSSGMWERSTGWPCRRARDRVEGACWIARRWHALHRPRESRLDPRPRPEFFALGQLQARDAIRRPRRCRTGRFPYRRSRTRDPSSCRSRVAPAAGPENCWRILLEVADRHRLRSTRIDGFPRIDPADRSGPRRRPCGARNPHAGTARAGRALRGPASASRLPTRKMPRRKPCLRSHDTLAPCAKWRRSRAGSSRLFGRIVSGWPGARFAMPSRSTSKNR